MPCFGIALPPRRDVEHVGWLLCQCRICGCSWLWVVQWLGLWLLFAVFLEKLLGVCKELISLDTDRRMPIANTPGGQALASLATSSPPHWAGMSTCQAAVLSYSTNSNLDHGWWLSLR